MKINQLKQKVYQLTLTKTTKQLQVQKPELTKGRDLRKKDSWVSIYNTFKLIDDFQQGQTSQEILTKHGFKLINKHSSFTDLLNNVNSLSSLCNALESKIDSLQS
ncbi:MAG: hypothetical protein RLZZ381_1511 [Cyanobacteriota bacterium]|jgi:hypothetical protein